MCKHFIDILTFQRDLIFSSLVVSYILISMLPYTQSSSYLLQMGRLQQVAIKFGTTAYTYPRTISSTNNDIVYYYQCVCMCISTYYIHCQCSYIINTQAEFVAHGHKQFHGSLLRNSITFTVSFISEILKKCLEPQVSLHLLYILLEQRQNNPGEKRYYGGQWFSKGREIWTNSTCFDCRTSCCYMYSCF